MKVTFDFTHPDFKKHMPDQQLSLLNNYNKPITEEEFVASWTQRPRINADGERIRKASHKRTPSYARHKYRRFVSRFGFFSEKAVVLK